MKRTVHQVHLKGSYISVLIYSLLCKLFTCLCNILCFCFCRPCFSLISFSPSGVPPPLPIRCHMTTIHQSEQSFLLAAGHVAGYLKRRSKQNENFYLVLLQLAKYIYHLYGVIFRPVRLIMMCNLYKMTLLCS